VRYKAATTMRIARTILTTVIASSLVLVAACDKKDEKKADKKDAKADEKKADAAKTEDKAEVPAPTPAPTPAPEAPAAVETSPEMTNFLAKFDGTDAKVTEALKEFGASEAIHDDDMGMYMLSKPKVIGKEGDCYTFEAEAGITIRTYDVCWAEGKINKIVDKGLR
jgi:hypothetical protein